MSNYRRGSSYSYLENKLDPAEIKKCFVTRGGQVWLSSKHTFDVLTATPSYCRRQRSWERPESGRRDRTDTTYSRNSAPLHFVSPLKNSNAVKVLLEDPRIDPSMTDEEGFTVKLILFVSGNQRECEGKGHAR